LLIGSHAGIQKLLIVSSIVGAYASQLTSTHAASGQTVRTDTADGRLLLLVVSAGRAVTGAMRALDHLSSLDWAGRLARLAPDGRLARLPELGHDAFYQAAGTVAAVAAPFLTAAGAG
jgi:hypothetical protein